MDNNVFIIILEIVPILICNAQPSKSFELLLLHTNNINSNFEEDKYGDGGIGKALYLINKFKREANERVGPPVLHLNAGDNLSRNNLYNKENLDVIINYLNRLRPDAMCLGNHDLNVNLMNLTSYLSKLKSPIVGANIDLRRLRTLQKYVKPSLVLTIDNYKIGIVGLTTSKSRIPRKSREIFLRDELELARIETTKLYEMGVKIIIVLSHSGYEIDRIIAREIDHVDVIVSGHQQSFWRKLEVFKQVVRRNNGKYVPIVHGGDDLKYLGIFKVYFDEAGEVIRFNGEPMHLHRRSPQISLSRVKRLDDEVLADCRTSLTARCHSSECNYANLLTDAITEYHVALFNNSEFKGWTDYPITIINAGTVLKRIPKKGPLTMAQLTRTLYYDNLVMLVKIRGIYIRKALVQGLTFYRRKNGGFLQFSGLRVIFNVSRENDDALVRIFARCGDCVVPQYEILHSKQVYNIVVNEYLFSGHDGIRAFKDSYIDQKIIEGVSLGSLLADYLRKYKTVTPEHDRRLIVYDGAATFKPIQLFIYTYFYFVVH